MLLGADRYRGKISGDGGYSISPNYTLRRRLVALGQRIAICIVGIRGGFADGLSIWFVVGLKKE